LQNNTSNVIHAPFAVFVLPFMIFFNHLLFLVRAFTNRVLDMLDNDYSPKSGLDLLAKVIVRTSTLLSFEIWVNNASGELHLNTEVVNRV